MCLIFKIINMEIKPVPKGIAKSTGKQSDNYSIMYRFKKSTLFWYQLTKI